MIFILTDIMFSLQAETEPDEMNEEEVEATAPSLYPDLEGGNDDDFSGDDAADDQEDEDEPLLAQPAAASPSSSAKVTPKETSAAASPVASSTPRLLAPSAPSPDRKSDDTDTASVKSTEL